MNKPEIDWRAAYERTVGPAARAEYLETEVRRLQELIADDTELDRLTDENAELRARDEAAKAVVQAARVLVNHEIQPSAFLPFELLKSAVRAHDEDGGQDR